MEREKRELNKWKITAIVVMFLLLAVSILYALQRDQNKMVTEKTAVSTEPSSKKGSDEVNYADAGSWLFFADGARKDVDLFLIAPTADMGKDGNYNLSLSDSKTIENMQGALYMEKGIFNQTCRIYSPLYRQMTITVYDLPEKEQQQYLDIAYNDVKEAFLYYMEHENNGRPFMLAGFSQGGELAVELMKDLFGDGKYDDQFIATYAFGWHLTEDEVKGYSQLVPAQGSDDTGVVVVFDCEAEGTESTLIVPSGMHTYSINPLNWKTDSSVAEKEENLGAFFTNYDGEGKEIPQLCGAYINTDRGTVIVTDVNTEDYPEGIESLGAGSYHIYDYQFFFRNLEENVIVRADKWLSEKVAN